MELLWSGLIATGVAGAISVVVAILNHKNEDRRWLKDKKMRVYSTFVGDSLELMMSLKDVYETDRFEDKRYRNFLRKLRMADILILGSDEVIEQYNLVIESLDGFYKFIKSDQPHFMNYDEMNGHLISASMALRELEGKFRKDIGLKPSKSDILNYPGM